MPQTDSSVGKSGSFSEGSPFSYPNWLSFNTSSDTLPRLKYNFPPEMLSESSLNGSINQNCKYSMFAASKSVVVNAR